jgi:hypothetical protein
LRDSKGRFVNGHVVLPSRDSVSGRFISNFELKYRRTVYEVDCFLWGLFDSG